MKFRKYLLLSSFVLPISVLIASCGSGSSSEDNLPGECNSGNIIDVQVPFTRSGSLSGSGNVDRDCYKFTLTTSEFITASTSGSTDVVGRLYDSRRNLIAEDDDISFSSNNFNFSISRSLSAGTYYLVVFIPTDSLTGLSGSYTLNVR